MVCKVFVVLPWKRKTLIFNDTMHLENQWNLNEDYKCATSQFYISK